MALTLSFQVSRPEKSSDLIRARPPEFRAKLFQERHIEVEISRDVETEEVVALVQEVAGRFQAIFDVLRGVHAEERIAHLDAIAILTAEEGIDRYAKCFPGDIVESHRDTAVQKVPGVGPGEQGFQGCGVENILPAEQRRERARQIVHVGHVERLVVQVGDLADAHQLAIGVDLDDNMLRDEPCLPPRVDGRARDLGDLHPLLRWWQGLAYPWNDRFCATRKQTASGGSGSTSARLTSARGAATIGETGLVARCAFDRDMDEA